jgi:carbamoyl-phosphate synthase large subunit
VLPVYSRVDTCAAEFPAFTPYLYSNYESVNEAEVAHGDGAEQALGAPSGVLRERIVVLGSGPNRIGQGIEFDYCCTHASFAFQELGYETIMVNCNPETVSTDYDVSDRLYFEPLTLEHILNICDLERPKGVIVQFGGQTPLKLVHRLAHAGVPILGTEPDAIDLAEDRERFGAFMQESGIPMPEHGVARSAQEAFAVAEGIGYPVIVRPSYVLGGRAMAIIHDREALDEYIRSTLERRHPGAWHGHWRRRGRADPHRPLSRGRVRDGRGLCQRRRRRGAHRRHHGADRAGRRALGR